MVLTKVGKSMLIHFKGVEITRQAVLEAIKTFDTEYSDTNQYDSWLEKEQYKYALVYLDRYYPCKHILSQVSGIPTSEFNGGDQTNNVFIRLGFDVIEKP